MRSGISVSVSAADRRRLDIRYEARVGSPIAEFSWEGVDEGDQRSGRGWLAPGTAGRLVGHLYFHMGDDSGFVCEPWQDLQQPAKLLGDRPSVFSSAGSFGRL
jgi:hypothetical protein